MAVVLTDLYERLLTVTVNRPEKLNALNVDVIDGLAAAFEKARADTSVGAVILTGAGTKAFVAGADIAGFPRLTPASARDMARRGQAVLDEIEGLGKPVIAAVNGFALGGGCELAMACTLRIASSNARFGQPEVNLGLVPGYGGTQRLPRLVGKGRALELLLTGDQIGADEALRIGLVNQVVSPEELRGAAETFARRILSRAPVAVRYALEAVRYGLDMPMEQALDFEATLFALCATTEDMREGVAAFLGKRPPSFKGC